MKHFWSQIVPGHKLKHYVVTNRAAVTNWSESQIVPSQYAVYHESTYIISIFSPHKESINYGGNIFRTSNPCLTRPACVLLMTPQSIADDVTNALRATIVARIREKRYLTRKISILFTAVFTTGRVTWWRHQMETFPRYWPYVRGIHRSPVNSPHKGQWRGALMFYLICAWINGWVNNREAGDLRRNCAHYDVTGMRNCSW